MSPSNTPVAVRPYRPEDNARLIAFARDLGVPARVRLGVDRSPDFCALNRIQSETWDIFIAEAGSEIVGFIDLAHIPYRFLRRECQATYVNLTGVRAAWRNTNAFIRLINESHRIALARGSSFSYALVNIRNERLVRFAAYHFPDSRPCDRLAVNCLLLGPRYRYDRDYSYAPAAPHDLPEILDLLRSYHEDHAFAPVIDRQTFPTLPGFTVKNIFLARDRRHRIVASLGVWDQSAVRRIRLMEYDLPTRILRGLLNGGRYFLKCARLPGAGQYLQYLSAVHAAAARGREKAFSGLVRFVCNECADGHYQFLMLALTKLSPLAATVRGLIRITNTNVPIIIPFTESLKNQLFESRDMSFNLEYALS